MVLTLRLGVGKLNPVAKAVPPVCSEYHFTSLPLAPGVAVSVTVPVPQRDAPLPVGDEGAGLIVAVTGIRGDVLSQPVEVLNEDT